MGGRLKHFKTEWFKLTKDPELIQMISGCTVNLSESPPSKQMPSVTMSSDERTAACQHIAELLQKKAIVKTKVTQGDFVSAVFLVPKKDGGFRMILNLKEFNKFAKKTHFKMETLQHILYLVLPSCFMTGIDLIDAFLTIPLDCSFSNLFTFVFKGQAYKYVCLPFGFTDSPCIFTKVLKPVLAHLHSQDHIVTFYLDNSWQSAENYRKSLDTCLHTPYY